MFESAELGHHIDRAEFKLEEAKLREALLDVQYRMQERAEFPVVILLSGVPTAGKGEMANLLMDWMDPRNITTHAFAELSDEESARPEMYRYWHVLPPKGQIGILFGGWYTEPVWAGKDIKAQYESQKEIDRITRFERMLASEGVLLLKFWLHLSHAEMKKRVHKLAGNPLTQWRVGKEDKHFLKHYKARIANARTLLTNTNLGIAPWRVVEGTDESFRALSVGRQLLDAIEHRLAGETNTHSDA